MMIEYQWYIIAALVLGAYKVGIWVGVRVTTNEVLDIISKETKK